MNRTQIITAHLIQFVAESGIEASLVTGHYKISLETARIGNQYVPVMKISHVPNTPALKTFRVLSREHCITKFCTDLLLPLKYRSKGVQEI